MIPNSEPISHKDVLDGLIAANQKIVRLEQPDGTFKEEIVIDHEALWWQFHKVPSPLFARFAKVYKVLENKADQCYHFMTFERATVMSNQIKAECSPFKTLVDAKSSESRLNKLNKTQTIIDVLANQKSERIVSFKEEAGKSLKEAIVGKEKEQVE